MSTSTQTRTFTTTDIRRVLASFAADYSMIASATSTTSQDRVVTTVDDLIRFAVGGYLEAIHLILWDAANNKLRAAKYIASTVAIGWENGRPGNNLWPSTPGGTLQVIATLSTAWWKLDETGKARERQRLGIAGGWGRTTTDTSHGDMTAQVDRRYASNGYGLEKTIYR